MSNWPNNFNLAHPNWTAKTRSRPTWADYEGVGGWAKDSRTPPWGWPKTIITAVALAAVFIGGFSYIGAAVGLTG